MFDRIEPELQYCLQCGDEYRADITTCATCNIALVSGKEVRTLLARQQERSRQMSKAIAADEPVVTIRKGAAMQIKQLQEYLMENSIASRALADPSAPRAKG
ncbi:MAG: hypothetical protein CSB34_02445 [Desulfobulbus propionicus]|nr:MAG: hypothetical protein CSB34_02445 [Desulfobulbus propionicus]